MPDFLYHYTTIDTLQYMFREDRHVEFRFTDYRFLNDAEEGTFLDKYVDRQSANFRSGLTQTAQLLFDEEKKKLNRLLFTGDKYFYIMSFGELEDSMQFWRQDYAKDKGICLKIDPSKFESMKTVKGIDVPKFKKVIYARLDGDMNTVFPELKDKLEKEAIKIDDGVSTIDSYQLVHFLPDPYEVKNAVWRSECEWRLYVPDKSIVDYKQDEYKIDNTGIPRTKIWIDNPFEEIILGPSFTPSYEVSIKRWLSDRGFDNINVRCGDGILNK